ncbi:MAG: triose-phosphate isomerase [Candidatus Paracaedimonas acanthamoebae]|uniref:Triosephosphate isomerase n=1 Tax=Candidatus Paracaedimonas acanthamoebae TaxID=244581 RepID=A0A8J7PZY9_9PROT|nr:triose-phosphate isomerase [Candidatus Paracaedimonas acanthamoebae]
MTEKRQKLIVANWKMNGTQEFSRDLAADLAEKWFANPSPHQIVVCPPFSYLSIVLNRLFGTEIACGAQDCSVHEKGAYTGEISSLMVRDIGCRYVIVGHSERRHHHQETSALVRQKAESALKVGLKPIICIGETLAEREDQKTLKILEDQLTASVPEGNQEMAIAYEPVWAIGTGKTATSKEILEVHAFIRSWMQKNRQNGSDMPILYGGSVTDQNAQEILSLENVDGVLVGGASLKSESFWQIVQAA